MSKTKIITEYDIYTNKKLLINLLKQVFKISNIKFNKIDGLDYAILIINDKEYITYSKVILDQLKNYDFINVVVVLKEHPVSGSNRKYHKLHIVPDELL